MATINGSTNSSNWTYKLDVTETSTSLANKTSTVRVRVYLGRANSQSYLGGDYKVTVNCGGQSQSFNGNISYPTYINADSWLLLKTFTFTVPNTGNPTKTSISSSMSSSDFTPSSASASGSMNLTVLHLAPEITNVTITETNTLMDLLGIKDDNIAQHLSKKKFLIETTTYDEATIDNYSIYHNNVLIGTSKTHEVEVDFSNVGELITAISNNKYYTGLTIAVTDNLGGYTTKMYNYEVTKYTKPTYENATTNIKRQTGNGIVLTDNKAILSFIGTYYGNNDVLGNNNKPKIKYKIWNEQESEEPQEYIDISDSVQIDGNNIKISNYELTNLLYTSSYNYKIQIGDNFTIPIEKEGKLATGISVWSEYKDRVDFKKITKQNNEVLSRKVLYESTQGTSENITLNDSSANYKEIEIFYYNANYQNIYSSVKVPDPNGKQVELKTIYPRIDNSRMYVLSTYYSISDKTLTYVSGYGLAISSESIYGLNQDTIKIVKVIGYK